MVLIAEIASHLLYPTVCRGLLNLAVFLPLSRRPSLSNTSSYIAASLKTGCGISCRGVPLDGRDSFVANSTHN